MAKKKVDKIKIESINGVRFPQPIILDIYYDNFFFSYIPDDIQGFVGKENLTYRVDKNKRIKVVKGDSPTSIKTSLYSAYQAKYSIEVKERKIISFRFKFNSDKHYFNHHDSITFADTPALSIWWRIYYHVTLPNGIEKIFSAPYKGYGSICTNKFDTYVSEYKEKWIDWTEERENFFNDITKSMDSMIERINGFFSKDSSEIALLVDNKAGLLNY